MKKRPQKTRKARDGMSTLYIREIPTDVKNKFKSWCAMNGMTMTEAIIMVMDDSALQRLSKKE